MSQRGGTTAGLAAVALWCLSGPALAAGSRELGAFPFLTIASALGVVTGVVFHLLRGGAAAALVRLPLRVVVASFFGVALYTVLLTLAVSLAPESALGQIVLINYLWPVMVILFGAALTEDRPPMVSLVVASSLGFAGVALCQGPAVFRGSSESLLPQALAFVGAVLWSLYSVLLRRWKVSVESCGSTLAFFFCALLAALIGLFEGSFAGMPPLTATSLVWIVVYGVGAVGLGYPLWELGMKGGEAQVIAVAANFIPLASAGIMALLFREAAEPWLIPGAVAVTAGAIIARRASRRRPLRS
jgi:drug/metabolite transporter (DMT)-like permease